MKSITVCISIFDDGELYTAFDNHGLLAMEETYADLANALSEYHYEKGEYWTISKEIYNDRREHHGDSKISGRECLQWHKNSKRTTGDT